MKKMKIKRFKFVASTKYINSGIADEVEIAFDGTETEEEIEGIVNEAYDEWLLDNVNQSWEEIID